MAEIPQLRMRHGLAGLTPRRGLAAAFALRAASAEDAEAIALVLQAAFGDPWDSERVMQELIDHPSVPVTFVIERAGTIVATASYQVKQEPDPEAGWLHWVGVHPDARGLGLGEIVSHRVLSEAIDRERSCVYLTTDDYRLAAIRIYLRLGFEPACHAESHAARWEAIRRFWQEETLG